MKKIFRILAIFLLMFIGASNSYKVNAKSYPTRLTNVKKGVTLKYNGYDYLLYKTSGSYNVFCLSFHKQYVGYTCKLSTSQYSTPVASGIAAIIKKYNNNPTQKNYYYSELAINEFLYYYNGKNSVNRISTTRNVRNTNGVKPFYDAAVKAYNDAKAKYEIKLSSSTLNFKLSGNYYVSNKIKVNVKNGNSSYSVSLAGDVKAEVYKKSGNTFYVRILKDKIKVGSTVNVKLTVSGKKTISIAKKFDCGQNYQKLTPNTTTKITSKASALANGKITLKGNKVNINKIDSKTKKPVSGAVLVVKDAKGNKIAQFTTKEQPYTLKNLKVGVYTVSEIKAKEGYELSKEVIKFTVSNDDKTINIDFKNVRKPNGVEISKQDITTKKELAGAVLVVKDENGKEIDKWTSTGEIHVIKDLKKGNYTLTEIQAPEGYKLKTETVSFTVKGDGTVTKVVMHNELKKTTVVNINKIDSKTKKPVSGAVLVVKDAKGNKIAQFTTKEQPYTLKNLKVGVYTVSEIKAKEGYELSKEVIKFTVSNDDKTINIDFKNVRKPNGVEISKQDITTKKELAGAVLVVKDENGKEIDKWTSTGEIHVIKDLKKGNYTLTEIQAPEGYKLKTETVSFTVKGDGTVTKVVMYNELKRKTIVRINKVDSKTRMPVSGAVLVIKDKNNKEIKSFVTGNSKVVLDDLEAGIYYIEETKAPEGYELSKEVVKFIVTNDDKDITVDFINTKKKENRVEISKQDITTKKELAGAVLVVKDENGKEIDKWTSTGEIHVIKDLKKGNYTLTEIQAPDGYVLKEENVSFTVKGDGTVTKVVMYNVQEKTPVPVVPTDNKNQVEISKQDITTKKELAGATLVIKDANGNEIDRWVSGNTPHYIALPSGNYTLTEIQAPDGYDLSYEVIKFTVTNTKDIQTIVMYNSKTPNTKDKNIVFIVSTMIISLLGISTAIFKIKHN